MKRFIAGLPFALVLGAMATPAAADAPSGATPAAQASTSLAQNSSTARASSTEPAATAGSGTRVVCLNVSLQCFRVAAAAGASPTAPAKALDLRAPDIRSIVSEAELRQRVEEDWLVREREDEQQVRVEGSRPEIYVPGGLASLGWAAMNPLQAWRIFLPVPASQTK